MSEQSRIFPHNINTILRRQVVRIKTKLQFGDYKMIQNQILQTKIITFVWQAVRRITNEILGYMG